MPDWPVSNLTLIKNHIHSFSRVLQFSLHVSRESPTLNWPVSSLGQRSPLLVSSELTAFTLFKTEGDVFLDSLWSLV
jgi:hypothetical protein